MKMEMNANLNLRNDGDDGGGGNTPNVAQNSATFDVSKSNNNNNSNNNCLNYSKKYYAWFTFYKNFNVCVFIDVVTQSIFYEIVEYSKLCLGTVLYGTMIRRSYGLESHFIVENIFYHNGVELQNHTLGKLQRLYTIFSMDSKCLPKQRVQLYMANLVYTVVEPETEIKQVVAAEEPIIQPIIQPTIRVLIQPSIQFQAIHRPIYRKVVSSSHYNQSHQSHQSHQSCQQRKRFKVKADLQCDVYHLWDMHDLYEGVAGIPTYKMSIFMNEIFRRIRENSNLDYMEESEDESDFENDSDDKYVDLEKEVLMDFTFNSKFQKWIPMYPLSLI